MATLSITVGDRCLNLPEATLRLVAEAVENLAEGRSVTLVTEDEREDEISPQEAAIILGVSRPFASKLFDVGAIPCRRIGTHRRALRGDVVASPSIASAFRVLAICSFPAPFIAVDP